MPGFAASSLAPAVRDRLVLEPRYTLVAVLAAVAASASLRWYRRRRMAGPVTSVRSKLPDGQSQGRATAAAPGDASPLGPDDPKATDPPLLRKHSVVRPYTAVGFTYPGVRTFYRRHPKADELPTKPAPIPLLVFVHGLGGSLAQFQPLLTTLIHVSSCLAIDLPGCGVSDFAPSDWDAFTTEALVGLLETVIESYRERDAGQGVVLIGHSYGAALCARLASKSPSSRRISPLSEHVLGLVAICPPSQPPSPQKVALFRKLLWIPTPIFNLWRAWDRRGGIESASVRRFVGQHADLEAKRLQCRFNNQSRTPVWRRMAWGCLPVYDQDGKPHGGMPGRDVWAGLQLPVYLIAGANDLVTPAAEVEKIRQWLTDGGADELDPEHGTPSAQPQRTGQHAPGRAAVADSAAPIDTSVPAAGSGSCASNNGDRARIEQLSDDDFRRASAAGSDQTSYSANEDPSTPRDDPPEIPPLWSPPRRAVETVVLPAPATHALLYTPPTARVLAGLVSDFLASQISGRLSLGWQLQFLSREGKWDVKNLVKWQGVAPVSAPIAGGIFRAMKTLREVDDTHCPSVFVATWGHEVRDIIDISHDTPVYDPRGLDAAGVRYHKFPTVSKIPPTDEEADAFVALVDNVRAERAERSPDTLQGVEGSSSTPPGGQDSERQCEPAQRRPTIGVHCHYGFNRTGFFIVCYLVERCGFDTQAAIDEFARARPHGIRHQHFLDKLFIRYSTLKQNHVRGSQGVSP